MDKKLKTKWVKALRSGKYKQGSQSLKADDNTFCCLGVLAQIQGASWTEGVPYIKKKPVSLDRAESLLSPTFCGIRTATQNNLANMNDGEGKYANVRKSFAEIADYIEKRL